MKQILKTIIKDFHSRPLPPFKPRHLDVPLDLGKIITLIGPRRAGKPGICFSSWQTWKGRAKSKPCLNRQNQIIA